MAESDLDHELSALERQAGPRLAADLTRLVAQQAADTPAVPAELDRRILDEAARHLARGEAHAEVPDRSPVIYRIAGWGAGLAAAAGLALALILWRRGSVTTPTAPPAVAVRGDVDDNGRVDILDAFAMQRLLERNAEPAAALDYNDDGLFDLGDVLAVAERAVSLDEEARS